MAGSANRRRRQSDGAHQAAESRSASKQQTNPAKTTQIRFRKISAFPDSFLTPRRSQRNEGRTEVDWKNFNMMLTSMWDVENAQSVGVTTTYTYGPFAGSIAFSDGFDTNVWNYLQLLG